MLLPLPLSLVSRFPSLAGSCRPALALLRPLRWLAGLTACCWLAAAPITKGPHLQAPGPDTMTIVWETLVQENGAVRYGIATSPDRATAPAKVTRVTDPAQTYFVYEVELKGLKPGTHYQYEVVCGNDRSGARPFTTFDRAAERVTFIMYGDTRTNPDKHKAIVEQFPPLNPSFILHSGDLVSRGKVYATWSRDYFDPARSVIDRIPMMPSIGNHEDDGLNYQAYFHLPEPERFYSFDNGPVHVLALDYTLKKATDDQYRFAEQDLSRSKAPWKVVLLHYPMFNLGAHTTFWAHDPYLPLFRKHKVDIVVAGHSHIYERFRPLVPKGETGAWAIQHITTGGGGAPLGKTVEHPSLAKHAAVHHYLLATVTAGEFAARTIDIDGKEIDRFTLRKTGGAQDPAWLAQAYPEEDVIAEGLRLNEAKKKTKK